MARITTQARNIDQAMVMNIAVIMTTNSQMRRRFLPPEREAGGFSAASESARISIKLELDIDTTPKV